MASLDPARPEVRMVVTTRITVRSDGAVSLADPLPPGEYPAAVTVGHHGPWDDSLPLRSEDMYGDDGR